MAVGVGDCKITIQNCSGELETLTLHGALYVPDARRNLISCSALAKDRFQVVLPSTDSISAPCIYKCRRNKSSLADAFPILASGSLFHVQTCVEAEVSRNDSKENLWVVWHRRLGYMPFETIRSMTTTSQGLDDLVGIPMPRNYISSNV